MLKDKGNKNKNKALFVMKSYNLNDVKSLSDVIFYGIFLIFEEYNAAATQLNEYKLGLHETVSTQFVRV